MLCCLLSVRNPIRNHGVYEDRALSRIRVRPGYHTWSELIQISQYKQKCGAAVPHVTITDNG